ncbi:MAG: Hpt domain-containing protein [Chloroflexota bacterium]
MSIEPFDVNNNSEKTTNPAMGGNNTHESSLISQQAFDDLLEMVGPDEPELLLELLDTFLEDSTEAVQKMPDVLANNDLMLLQRMVHSLKSTSATFGALYLAELCEIAESALRDERTDVDYPQLVEEIRLAHTRAHEALIVEVKKYL